MDTDGIHEFGSHEDWNESFYFNFYDRGQDICGFMRIGLLPNNKEKSVFCFLLLPDGSVIGTKDQIAMENNDLEVKGLKFTKIEEEKHWKLEFDGELPKLLKEGETEKVAFAFDFVTLNPVYDYKESMLGEKEKAAAEASVAAEHLEQFGRVSGKLTVGSKIYDLNAMGERDHSWGIRDWNAPYKWFWITAEFDEGFAFNLTKLWTDKYEIDAGFIYIDGKNIPIVRADVAMESNRDGSPNTVYMALHDKDGDVHGAKAVVKHKVTLPFPSKDGRVLTHMHECLARFTLDEEVGFGIVEFLARK